MNPEKLNRLLEQLIAAWENEVVEFKQASTADQIKAQWNNHQYRNPKRTCMGVAE